MQFSTSWLLGILISYRENYQPTIAKRRRWDSRITWMTQILQSNGRIVDHWEGLGLSWLWTLDEQLGLVVWWRQVHLKWLGHIVVFIKKFVAQWLISLTVYFLWGHFAILGISSSYTKLLGGDWNHGILWLSNNHHLLGMSSSQLTNSLHHFFGQSWGTVTVNIWVEEGGYHLRIGHIFFMIVISPRSMGLLFSNI